MTDSDLAAHVNDPARLAALYSVALLDTPAEEAFDRLSRLAARLLDAPVALVSLVDTDRQFFKSCIGLRSEPWSSDRETPLTHSFCQHNRIAGQPLIVEDARVHPVFRDNPAIQDLDAIAYLGFPLTTTDGYVIGSFCAIDTKPRTWAPDDIEVIRDLSGAVMVEIQLRTEIATRHQAEGERDVLSVLNTKLVGEIRARKQAEDHQQELEARLHQTRKIEALGQLAGGIAHDLSNLLSPILIYTSVLLTDDRLAANHRDIIDQVQAAGLRARDLIRQLLTFSRLQAMNFEVHDLNRIVSDLEKLLRRAIPEDIEMVVTLDPDASPILADSNQIEQIVMNLVVNAADAMPDGGILQIATKASILDEVALSENDEAQPGRFATLTVADNGIGMEPQIRERIFEPFFSTKGGEGNGLGLSTVLGIALRHGGVVRSSSQVGVGTTFQVHLPVTTEQPAIREPDPYSTDRDGRRSATVMVAEDDEHVRRVTKLLLEQRGYHVLEASDGAEALTVLRDYDDPIHLLLTDVVMPGLNGRVLFEKASEHRPGLRVLYMSGYSEDIISHRGVIETGMNFIAKPFMEDELLAQIELVLQPTG